MFDKKELMLQLQKNPDRYWKVKLFDELGFKRRQCSNCGKFFWAIREQSTCNDSTCRTYDFIGKPPTKKRLDYLETWEVIKKFFEKNNHEPLKRYPVVCRWFSPLYFTVAGIVDFYREYNGNFTFEFPANPLILTQPCLRFNDIYNVGINAKSYTSFLMIQQCSKYDSKSGYWKDKCIDLDFELLTKVFGIKPEEIVFIEDVWLGSGAFGSSLEYHVQGLELGNAVFTEFVGTIDRYSEMKEKVIDMGAGQERFAWITQGTPTSYDATFGPVIEKMKKISGIDYDREFFLKYSKYSGCLNYEVGDVAPIKKRIASILKVSPEMLEKKVQGIEALYAIAEHVRGLVFAISDSGLPSNVGGGYNLRVILRRALSFIDKFKWNFKLDEIGFWHIDYLKKLFPELEESKNEIAKILDVEEKRFMQDKKRSKKIIENYKGKKISEDDLQKLYTSQGITPEELGVEVPSDFYIKLTEKHQGEIQPEGKWHFDISNTPDTKVLYYEHPVIYNFDARVVRTFDEGKFVVLDQTAFYPTSGGQLHDKGTINGVNVLDVQKIKNVIIHQLENPIKDGKVSCKIDKTRRDRLTKHHTATHIINAAARKVLGKHVWQAGSEKEENKARLDITHYESLGDSEIEKIENEANAMISQNLPVTEKILPRMEAEKRFGFTIYQGGAIPLKFLRIVSIGDVDHEADGGTHVESTGQVGGITILRTKRIQDGVVRLEYAAGDVAVSILKEKEKILKEAAWKLGVKEEQVPEAVEKLFKEWKKVRKK